MNKQDKQPTTGTLGEPTTKREALKLALLCAITAPEHESKKREQCIQWAEKLAQELGEEVTESVKAEINTETEKNAPVNFKQFQATRKKVTAPYGYMDDSEYTESAFTYMGTFERFIEESYHISIWADEELIKKHGGKYWLILDRSEYNSNDLEQLEKMLFEFFMQEN